MLSETVSDKYLVSYIKTLPATHIYIYVKCSSKQANLNEYWNDVTIFVKFPNINSMKIRPAVAN
jgi:hypothetical protein